jgi:probable addiction module antidote protein
MAGVLAAALRCRPGTEGVSLMARKKTRPGAPLTLQARHEFAVAYLNAMLEDAGPEELAAALARIARASGGPGLAEKVELSADSLYRTLCRRGNPELRSTTALLKAMGMRLVLQSAIRHGTCVGSGAGRDERDSHG